MSVSNILGEFVGRIRSSETRLAEAESKEWVGPTRGCRVYRNANQSIPNAAFTPIAFTTEIFDKGGCWSVAQPTRLVAPRDGYYVAEANVSLDNAGDTDGQRALTIRSSAGDYLGMVSRIAAAAAEGHMNFQVHTGLIYLVAADWVTIELYQNSGAAKNVLAASIQEQCNCHASLVRMH